MDYQILKCLLNHAFWIENRQHLNPSLFEDEIKELFEVLEGAHEKYDVDITTTTLFALWKNVNPVSTNAEQANIKEAIEQIDASDDLPLEIASDLITDLWRRETGRKAAQFGIEISEGKTNAFEKLDRLIVSVKDGFLPDEFGEEVTKDIDELLKITGDENRWQFNIPVLSNRVYGIGPTEFMEVFARPETGKTAFGVSLAAGPRGFCEQGASVLIAGNEEDARRTMLRAVECCSGMDEMAVTTDPESAKEAFKRVQDNLHIIGTQNWTLGQLEKYIEKLKPDIVIADILDKFVLEGDLEGHARLKEIYVQSREIAKRQNVAFIATSQASVDAEGKTILTPEMMEGSKTGKFAEGDLIIGIGKAADDPNGTPNNVRFLTVGKNKLNGFHGTIVCKIEPKLSRYGD